MSRYLMLLHENPATFAAMSPAELQAILEEYARWSDALLQEGRLLQGEKLRDDGGRRTGLEQILTFHGASPGGRS